MATKLEMEAAFGSLLDTMSRRFDPFFDTGIVARWLAVTALSSNIAEPRLWSALPSDSPGYAGMVSGLNRVTNKLVGAVLSTNATAILDALDEIDDVLTQLQRMITRDGDQNII
jgi:hypothetical protein